MEIPDVLGRARVVGGVALNEAARRAMQVEPVADLYFGLMELRSPTKGKLARRAFKNERINEYYWQWRDRKVREPKSTGWRSRRSGDRGPRSRTSSGLDDHWLDSP